MNGAVKALASSGNLIYAVGDFTVAGSTPANHVAVWNRQSESWSALGAGVTGTVNAVAVSGSTVYVGGTFTQAGTTTVSNIAKWDGTNWTALGGGVDGTVKALAVDGGNVYVGGTFNQASNQSGLVLTRNLALWNGSNWSAVGAGVSGGGNSVSALAVAGGNLYIGGSFIFPAANIAKFSISGGTLSGVGTGTAGTNGAVNALAPLTPGGTSLYVGGNFTTAGGTSVNYVALLNGSAWSALGTGTIGTSGPVSALTVVGSGVYAGGSFTTAGGTPVNNIAGWSGTAWSALGSGTNAAVSALASSGTYLYAGGNFTQAGNKASSYIGRYDMGLPAEVGVSLSNSNPTTNATLVATTTIYPSRPTPTYTYVWKNGSNTVKTTSNTSSTTDTLNLSLPGNGDKGNVITVSVTATDPVGTSLPATASATVVNSAPIVNPIVLSTWAGRNFLGRLEFTDIDNDTVTLSNVTGGGAGGTVTLGSGNASSFYLYNAPLGTGTDNFVFTFTDGTVSLTQTAAITVTAAPPAGSRLYTALGASDVQGFGASDYEDVGLTSFSPANSYAPQLAASDKLGASPGTLILSRRAINGLTLASASRSINGQSTISLAVADKARSYTIWFGPNDVLNELLPLLIANASSPANFNAAKTTYINNWKSGYDVLAATLRGANPTAKFAAITVPDLGPDFSARAAAQLGLNANTQAALSSAITDACTQMSTHIKATFPAVDIQGQSDLGQNDANLIFDPETDLFTDGYHPNDSGYNKLATRLFRQLVNKAPLNSLPASGSTPRSTALVFSSANGNAISIGDVDAGTYTMAVSFSASSGRPTFPNAPANLVISGPPGTPVLTGTLSQINSALEGMTFIPSGTFDGNASLTISTDDLGNGGGAALTDSDTLPITVTAVNRVPVARPDSGSLAASSSLNLNVLANDTDQDGDALTVTLPTPGAPTAPTKGTLVLNGNNTITYTNNGTSGSDSFTYTVSDGQGGTATAVVTLAITAPTSDIVNVTNSPVSINPYGFTYNVRTKRYVQQVILKNTGTTTITTPLFLVLDNLSTNATLFNKSGNITSFDASGSPYLTVSGPLAPGASVVATLEFVRTGNTGISYTSRVLTGTGTP
jgi:lysophospholipase L1-like esterase